MPFDGSTEARPAIYGKTLDSPYARWRLPCLRNLAAEGDRIRKAVTGNSTSEQGVHKATGSTCPATYQIAT